MTTDPNPDFHGCNSECRRAGAHTLRWGGCEHAPKPEPTVSMSMIYKDPEDGYPSIGFDSYTVATLADLIEPALRRVHARIGPNALAMLHRGETVALTGGEYADLARAAAHAIVHRNDEQPAAAPAAVPPTDRAGLRDLLTAAIRAATCPGDDCPHTETDCAEQRIQPGGWEHGVLSEVSGRPEQFADAVLALLFGPIPAGTGAPWDAIRERAAELAVLPAPVDRAAVLRELIAEAEECDGHITVQELRRMARKAEPATGTPQPETQAEADGYCKCRSCWGWFVEEHPGEDLDDLGKNLRWWSGLPEHRDAPAGVTQPETRTMWTPGPVALAEAAAFGADLASKTSPKADTKAGIVHACPGPDDSGISPCCGRPPFEFRGERLTRDPAKVTCPAPAVTLPGKEA